MAKWIYAEEKKYPGDEGYQPPNASCLSSCLNGYDSWVLNKRIKKRIQKDNRKWMTKQIFIWAVLILYLCYRFYTMIK